jgi:mannose-6-phosphate isomerase
MFKPYPITVEPILKEQVWGGTALHSFVKLPKGRKTGEAWFFADQPGNESIVSSGACAGMSLGALMKKHKKSILGPVLSKKYGAKFPLLFKFIDSRDRLSVQVHPDDEMARRDGCASGKTEAWYVIDSGWGSYVRLGFKHNMTAERMLKMARLGKIQKEMKKYPTHRGDSFLIPAGTVHSIGPSNLIFEVQQNSDITYRLYDWGRKNLGVQRELHIDRAIEAVRFGIGAGKYNNRKTSAGGVKIKKLAPSPLFSLTEAAMEKNSKYWYNERSALVIAVVGGEIEIEAEGRRWKYRKGGVILIPYDLGAFMLKAVRKSKIVITKVK